MVLMGKMKVPVWAIRPISISLLPLSSSRHLSAPRHFKPAYHWTSAQSGISCLECRPSLLHLIPSCSQCKLYLGVTSSDKLCLTFPMTALNLRTILIPANMRRSLPVDKFFVNKEARLAHFTVVSPALCQGRSSTTVECLCLAPTKVTF